MSDALAEARDDQEHRTHYRVRKLALHMFQSHYSPSLSSAPKNGTGKQKDGPVPRGKQDVEALKNVLVVPGVDEANLSSICLFLEWISSQGIIANHI